MEQHNPTQNTSNQKVRRLSAEFRLIQKRVGNAIITVVVIAYMTVLGLILAERGREHLPAQPLDAMWQSLLRLFDYALNHPTTIFWNREIVPVSDLLRDVLTKSAGLLLSSMIVALIIGIFLGVSAALSKQKISSALVLSLSVLGISTPSFLLAMLFWVLNIYVHRTFDVAVLPSVGFGWDAHMIMPMLVLSMRPMAQIAQVTYVSLRDVMREDYIRTAKSKGLSMRVVRNRHALRNIIIPIITTLGASLRYSLASLVIVELFFDWPGVGLTLYETIIYGEISLTVDMILSLGLFFILTNLFLEILFPLLDARTADDNLSENIRDETTFLGWWNKILDMIRSWISDIRKDRGRRKSELPPMPTLDIDVGTLDEIPTKPKWLWILRNILINPSLILGSLLVIGLIWIFISGPTLTAANPYQTTGVIMIEGTIAAPPFEPSTVFPWGSDYVGRDIQALVLYGARQTLTLAFFGMLARLALGTLLGALAGWSQGGWFDRFVSGAVGVWAAFPITLFAMILIQAIGIQQGMWVFIFAVCIVGWGEIAQFVRGQVIAIKPQPYIESARSVGLRSDQIMIRHVVPNLMNGLITLSVLEMGGVLMLLAELGYINIFLGGGFQTNLGETGQMQAFNVIYSDVPEWAAMIANIRTWWRSYPWMAVYPGLAFFVSILAFNLAGEGLRRFFEDSQINLSRLANRYTFLAGFSLIVALSLVLQGASPMAIYRPEAEKFNPQNVIEDIRILSSMEMEGRESGTEGAQKAAEYIAKRMEDAGLIPAGEQGTYFQNLVNPRLHLVNVPTLSIVDSNNEINPSFNYREDFAELAVHSSYGDGTAEIVGLALGQRIAQDTASDPYQLAFSEASGQIVIVRGDDLEFVNRSAVSGILVVADETFSIARKDVFPRSQSFFTTPRGVPIMVITPEVADQLLITAGSSLAELDSMAEDVAPGEIAITDPGTVVEMTIRPEFVEDFIHETYINVVGVYPSEATFAGLDSQVILVSAYYDGLGMGPDGTFYPGANDNMSGVAMMLEMARILKESAFKPDKSVLFVAWSGGERSEGFSVTNVMNARPGGATLTATEVIELSGVGYGTGDSIAISDESSYRLVRLFQEAAGKFGVATTTRGRNPHYGHGPFSQYGERTALTLALSWDGSDHLVHTTADTPEIIDPEKLYDTGSTTTLVMFILAR
ncbi:MAG TPA: ABC transporter permease subunit, partial [Anaerolineales bacterium]|nr:ABC transporter permease subunit [Anaerolineales bacterium]